MFGPVEVDISKWAKSEGGITSETPRGTSGVKATCSCPDHSIHGNIVVDNTRELNRNEEEQANLAGHIQAGSHHPGGAEHEKHAAPPSVVERLHTTAFLKDQHIYLPSWPVTSWRQQYSRHQDWGNTLPGVEP